MTNENRGGHGLTQLHVYDAPPAELLDTPLDYVFADHFRQRSVCAALKRIARECAVPRIEADRIATFLSVGLSVHHQDEELDIFPAVKLRAQPEDDLDPILDRLSEDHRALGPLIEQIVLALSASGIGDVISIADPVASDMMAYASREHKHLVVENGIVLVIARKRLTRGDLAKISVSMKTRRGLVH
jgi:hemerythrin-like domain-containing protein